MIANPLEQNNPFSKSVSIITKKIKKVSTHGCIIKCKLYICNIMSPFGGKY